MFRKKAKVSFIRFSKEGGYIGRSLFPAYDTKDK